MKYHPRVEDAILEGQPIFLVGTDPVLLARRLNELCRRHRPTREHDIPYWVACARDTTAFHEVSLGDAIITPSGAAQTQAVISALRQDPDGLIAAPLFPDAAENFLRALLSGHNFAVYATLEYPSVAEAIGAWRRAGLPDDVLAPALDDIVFIEWQGGEHRYVEAELLDGLLDIWEPEGLESAGPRLRLVKDEEPAAAGASAAAAAPARLTAQEVGAWVQERSRAELGPLLPHARPAFVPLTEDLGPEEQMLLVTYARAAGLGELLLQLQAEHLPPAWAGRLAPGTYLQLFASGRGEPREYRVLTVTEEERRRAPVGFPAGSFLRGRYRLKRWLEVQDFPHPAEFARLGIADGPAGACVPFTKLGGWPAWVAGAARGGPAGAEPLLFQIDSESHEFELALGAVPKSYVLGEGPGFRVIEAAT